MFEFQPKQVTVVTASACCMSFDRLSFCTDASNGIDRIPHQDTLDPSSDAEILDGAG